MIKLCNIINFNNKTRVVIAMFEDRQIQFVSDKDIVSGSMFIEKTEDGFNIVDKSDYLKSLKTAKKCIKKNTENIVD